MPGNFHGSKILNIMISLILLATLFITLLSNDQSTPTLAHRFILVWLYVAIISSIMMKKEFVTGFLICSFSTLIAWRIAAIYNVISIIYPLFISFIFLCSNFLYNAYQNMHDPNKYKHQLSSSEWQLIFIRLYLGFNFIPHFTEKLFAGSAPHLADVQAFISLGVPHADLFVWLAGLCEFGAAIAIGMGFMMRLGSLGAAIYLFIATFLGHHFSLGFIWAGQGGGWEFSALWMTLILSYAFIGFNQFSLDQEIKDRFFSK